MMETTKRYVDIVVSQLAAPTGEQQSQLLPLLNESGNGLAAAVVMFPVGPAKLGRGVGLSVELVGRPFLIDGMYRRQSKYPVDILLTLQPVSINSTEDTQQQVWGQPLSLSVPEKLAIIEALVEHAIVRVGVTSVMHVVDEVDMVNDDGTYSHTERAVHLMFGIAVCRAGVILTKAITVGRRGDGFGIVAGGGGPEMVDVNEIVEEIVARTHDAFGDTLLGLCLRYKLADILRSQLGRKLHEEVAHMAHTDIRTKGFKQEQTRRVHWRWSDVFGRWPAVILEVNHRPKDTPATRTKRAIELE